MSGRILRGIVTKGTGSSGTSLAKVMPDIRKRTGLPRLRAATINIKLPVWYTPRPDVVLWADEYGHHEHLFLTHCRVFGEDALILRTSQNHHGSGVIEVMAQSWVRRKRKVKIGDRISVRVPANGVVVKV